jgi:hypothetical protein
METQRFETQVRWVEGLARSPVRFRTCAAREPGKGADTYRMRVNAYDSDEKILEGGNVQIRRQ